MSAIKIASKLSLYQKIIKKLTIMKTENLTICGVYLGRIIANPGRTFVCVHVLHFCDTDAPDRKIVPDKPYRLNALFIEKDDARGQEMMETLNLLSKGSYVELHIRDVEDSTIISVDDIIIKQETENVTASRLADFLDEK